MISQVGIDKTCTFELSRKQINAYISQLTKTDFFRI